MKFTLDETKAILAHPSVDAAMRRIAGGRTESVPETPPWRFADRDNLSTPFRLFHACVKRAVVDALLEDVTLLPLLHHDPFAAEEVATVAEDYAVEMQFGSEGVLSYREFIRNLQPEYKEVPNG
jgi:hypothetical protein